MRARWKEFGLGLLTLLLVACAITVAQLALQKHVPPSVGMLMVALVCLLAYLAGARWIERRRVDEFASARAVPQFFAGLLTGFALFASVMAVLWAMGVYHPSGWGEAKGILAGLVMAMMAGITEELLFRGLLFRLSARIVGTWGALLFTSSLFGLAHMGNHGATLVSGIAIMLEAGMLLGAAYAMTERLWLPIGLHVGWNFTEGSVFSMSVSGNATSSGIVAGSLSGPPTLTGGAFGPEASIVAVTLCFLLALFFLYRAVKVGRIVPPAWTQRLSAAASPASDRAHA